MRAGIMPNDSLEKWMIETLPFGYQIIMNYVKINRIKIGKDAPRASLLNCYVWDNAPHRLYELFFWESVYSFLGVRKNRKY